MKLKSAILFLFMLTFSQIKAQQAVTTSGAYVLGSTGTVSYSIGQVAYTTNSGSGGSINEGVHQPYEFFSIGIEDNKAIHLEMLIYPNPTHSSVNLKIDAQNMENLSFQLYAEDGKLIIDQKIAGSNTTIPMENLAAATYFIKVTHNIQEIKTIKIIKNK